MIIRVCYLHGNILCAAFKAEKPEDHINIGLKFQFLHSAFFVRINLLMFKEIIDVYSENNVKQIRSVGKMRAI
jgi:hypothetical protein